MKKLCSILLITAICVSMVACGSKNKEKRQVNSIVTTMGNNASFPSAVNVFSTTDLEGNTVTNDIFSQADLTVVNFWGTFCNPCIDCVDFFFHSFKRFCTFCRANFCF